MTEKELEIDKLREKGNIEANLVKRDIILIVKATLYSFLILTFILIIIRIF